MARHSVVQGFSPAIVHLNTEVEPTSETLRFKNA
jgi:hypothetical protein